MSVRQSQKKPSPLPSKDGVHASYLWLPPGQWPDLMTFLLDYFPNVTREIWLKRIAHAKLRYRDDRLLLDLRCLEDAGLLRNQLPALRRALQ